MLEYKFSVVYAHKKRTWLPVSFQGFHLVDLSSPEEAEKKKQFPEERKIFCSLSLQRSAIEKSIQLSHQPFENCKIIWFCNSKMFLVNFFKTVENAAKSSLTCARIHSNVEYKSMEFVVAIYSHHITLKILGALSMEMIASFIWQLQQIIFNNGLKLNFREEYLQRNL